MRVAIVHDWFINPGGSEKVTSELINVFPEADLFCLMDFLSPEDKVKFVHNKKTITSFFQGVPFAKKYYRFFFPLFPSLISKFNVEKYDLIISSSHSIAKGIKTNSNQTHICYIHTPVRYAWDLRKQYLQQVKNIFIKNILSRQLKRLQEWDLENSKDVDFFISNSNYVKERVKKNYNRNSKVIYPPVDIDFFTQSKKLNQTEPYFLVVSRLVLYKRIDLIVKAFNQLPQFKLLIAGDGPQKKALQSISNSNITFLEYQSDESIKKLIQSAQATVFAANEDFGITPVESQACGTPVIALNRGGYKETITPNKTGVLYANQTVKSLIDGICKFAEIEDTFDSELIRQNSIRFGTQRFRDQIITFVNDKMDKAVQ